MMMTMERELWYRKDTLIQEALLEIKKLNKVLLGVLGRELNNGLKELNITPTLQEPATNFERILSEYEQRDVINELFVGCPELKAPLIKLSRIDKIGRRECSIRFFYLGFLLKALLAESSGQPHPLEVSELVSRAFNGDKSGVMTWYDEYLEKQRLEEEARRKAEEEALRQQREAEALHKTLQKLEEEPLFDPTKLGKPSSSSSAQAHILAHREAERKGLSIFDLAQDAKTKKPLASPAKEDYTVERIDSGRMRRTRD
ncbi:MAG: hypothetical protein ACKO37_06095 [Vampirovibrionales bacterium]